MRVIAEQNELTPDPVPLWFLKGFVPGWEEARGGSGAVWNTPVSQVMTSEVVTAGENLSVDSLRRLLLERGVGGVPVLDGEGKLRGIATRTDVLRALDEEGGHRRKAGEIMTPFAFALPHGASIGRAAALMAYEGIHRVLVVNERGGIAGVVSALDVARWLAREAGFCVP